MFSEDDLVFTQTRLFSPMWDVSVGGKGVATVTERYIAHEKYIVEMSGKGDRLFNKREDVINYILTQLT